MDQTERYLDLVRQGRDEFMQHAAPAALVRLVEAPKPRGRHGDVDEPTTAVLDPASARMRAAMGEAVIAVHPLVKKPGAAFSEMITVGRTGNNDVVLDDVTVSRFHAYFRPADGGWKICDSGSKNGTSVGDATLDPRKEEPIASGEAVSFGDVATRFFTTADLYDYLAANA